MKIPIQFKIYLTCLIILGCKSVTSNNPNVTETDSYKGVWRSTIQIDTAITNIEIRDLNTSNPIVKWYVLNSNKQYLAGDTIGTRVAHEKEKHVFTLYSNGTYSNFAYEIVSQNLHFYQFGNQETPKYTVLVRSETNKNSNSIFGKWNAGEICGSHSCDSLIIEYTPDYEILTLLKANYPPDSSRIEFLSSHFMKLTKNLDEQNKFYIIVGDRLYVMNCKNYEKKFILTKD